MKWTGDPGTDLRLSLVDDSETVILGQVIKDGNSGEWTVFDYHTGAEGQLLTFTKIDDAKICLELAIKGVSNEIVFG